MRSQANIVGYVLLIVAVVGITFGVYFWGKPVLEKSQARDYASSLERIFIHIADLISETANKGVTNTYTIDLSKTKIVISSDGIEATINSPYALYTIQARNIPINTKYLFECKNNKVRIGQNTTICEDKTLQVNTTDTYLILYDKFFNTSLKLPLTDHKDVIFSKYVFDIKKSGDTIYFLPKGIIGVVNLDPDCIVTAMAMSHKDGQTITYKVNCRVMYDPETKNCYRIQITPVGNTLYTEGSLANTILISYDSSKYVSNLKSTSCKTLKIINVKVSFV